MTDREMLELAAKAAGYELDGLASNYIAQGVGPDDWLVINDRGGHSVWNPLANDGDALRLAVKLGLVVCVLNEISTTGIYLPAEHVGGKYDVVECHEDSPYSATRRAIVRAAAEIGRAMP